MHTPFLFESTGKQLIVSLRGLSHEACVAITQPTYWQQLTKGTTISISANGQYVPKELETIINDEDPPRLQLVIKSECEHDKKLESLIIMLIISLILNRLFYLDISWQIFNRFFSQPSYIEDISEYNVYKSHHS